MNNEPIVPWHYSFRIILIGDSSVGKSTLLKVFTKSNFTDEGEPTVGVDYFATIVDLTNGLRVRLQAWDTAGQEKFRSITKSYYRNSVGALLLFDVTRRSSFDHLIDWLFDVRRHIEPSKAVYQIVGCKIDLENEREISTEEGQAFADFHSIKYIETSAKTRQNVDQAFKMISEQIYAKLRRGEFTLNPEWDGIKAGSLHLSSIVNRSTNGSFSSISDSNGYRILNNDNRRLRGAANRSSRSNRSKCC
ncbi:ras-related protein Rab-39B [Tetranychus urticae]|uniref:Uncharacterized protein n=1 Tax=Tetranychus urticae TaxID=32264 RepID=T1KX39_TETUR|nr:ras-related protein Rab-39B [Tetranychus urticae]